MRCWRRCTCAPGGAAIRARAPAAAWRWRSPRSQCWLSHAGLRALRPHAGELVATALTFGVLGAVGLVALARRRALLDLALWVVAPALLVSYFASHNFKVFHPRYLAVAVPGVLMLFAA